MNQHGKSSVPLLIFILAVAVLILVPWVYGMQYPRSVASVFDDVVTYGKLSALVGFMSDLGITLWMAMAVLMAHAYHRRLESGSTISREEKSFYLVSTLVLLFLALDDRLLIHEWLIEEKSVPKWIIMGIYGAVVVGCGMRFRKHFAGKTQIWIWAALAAFGVSEVVDLSGLGHEVIEEGAKWIGICALFLHIFTLTTKTARSSH